MSKRGMSTVIASLILILLCLIALGFVGVTIKNSFQEGADKISVDQFTLDLEISRVQVLNETDIEVTVKRNSGEGDLSGVAFVLYDNNNSEIVRQNISMKELEEKNFSIILKVVNATLIEKISIAPIFKRTFRKDILGDIQDEKPLRSGGGGGSSGGGGTSSDSTSQDNTGEPQEPFVLETCWDEKLNNEETEVDCGGPNCLACADPSEIHYLVQDGVALADIVISSDAVPSNIYAAKILQRYIYNMTGVMLSVNNNPSENYDFHVYIGQSSYTDSLGVTDEGNFYGGYKMVSGADDGNGDGYLILLGQDDVFVPVGPLNNAEFQAYTGELWMTDYYGYGAGQSFEGIYWRDKRGSLNAVFEFLHEQGVRFYHPGWFEYPGLGTIIPSKTNIRFTDTNRIINPDFFMRNLYIYSMFFSHIGHYNYGKLTDEVFAWRTSLKDNSFREFTVGALGGPGHGMHSIIKLQNITHPEFFSMNSSLMREINVSYQNVNLCYPYYMNEAGRSDEHVQYLLDNFPGFTNEDVSFYLENENELFDQAVRYAKAMFDAYDVPMVSLMPNDGFSRISYECRGIAEDEPYGNGMYSNYVWEFVNNVAWEIYNDPNYAGKKISNSAYTTYLLPPDKLSKPLAPNIEVGIARWRSNDLDPEDKEYYLQLFDDWFTFLASNNYLTEGVETNTFSTYDYYIHNAPYRPTRSIPAYIPHVISEDLQRLKGKSVGEFIEISVYHTWPLYNYSSGESYLEWDSFASTALNTYITSRLYWDADQDVDVLLEEYYTLNYGPARDKMKELVEYTENNYGQMARNPEFLRTIRQMANEALLITGEGTDYWKRVNLLLTQINSTYFGDQEISSCQVLDAEDTVYTLTNDVTAEETCFIFAANGVTLDCQGHTITYSTSTIETGTWQQAYDHGIDINGRRTGLGDYFKVTNCVIQDGGYKEPGNATGSAIYLENADIGIIENTVINNPRGQGIEAFNTYYNVYRNNNVSSERGGAFYEQMNDPDEYSNSTLENNYFYSGLGNAVYFYQGHGNELTGNTIISGSSAGLYFNMCDDNVLRNNVISGGSNDYLDGGERNDFDASNTLN